MEPNSEKSIIMISGKQSIGKAAAVDFLFGMMEPVKSKVTIILVSGKRSSGKDTAAEIIKQYIKDSKQYNTEIDSIALAYATKVGYCKENNLDLDRMVNDYAFKESHRMGLLKYYLTHNDPLWYSDYVLEYIESKHNNENINYFVIPDLRILAHTNVFKSPIVINKLSVKCLFIRINATEETKKSRGWIKKDCDDDYTETELDNYTGFDIIINNDGTVEELQNKLYNFLSNNF